MFCDEIKTLIIKYFDNEITEKEQLILSEHINSCETCRAEYDEMQKVFSVLETEKNDLLESREFYFRNIDPLEVIQKKYEKKLFKFRFNPVFGFVMIFLIGLVFFFYISVTTSSISDKSSIVVKEKALEDENGIETIYEDHITLYINQNFLIENININDFSQINYFHDVIEILREIQNSFSNNFYGTETIHADELTENDVKEIIAQLETKQF